MVIHSPELFGTNSSKVSIDCQVLCCIESMWLADKLDCGPLFADLVPLVVWVFDISRSTSVSEAPRGGFSIGLTKS